MKLRARLHRDGAFGSAVCRELRLKLVYALAQEVPLTLKLK